jgi:aspartate aminotransferase
MKVSKLAGNLKGSEILKIAGEINELRKQGEQITNLTIGDFNPAIYPIPAELTEEIGKAYGNHLTNYPPADGIPELRESVGRFLLDNFGLKFGSKEILISSGSRPILYAAYMALVDPGEKVLFPLPSWNNNHYSDLVGARLTGIPTRPENNFMPEAEDFRPHLDGAVLLALCSPLNPSGTMFTKASLEGICDLVLEENARRGEQEKPLYLLYDQIYAMLTFGEHKHYDPVSLRPEMRQYTVYVDGASKCFAATGVRVGWGFGPEEIIDKMRTIIGHMGAWAPKPEQVAMAEFLDNRPAVTHYLSFFKSKIRSSLDLLFEGFAAMKADGLKVDAIEPMGAMYLTLKLDYAGARTPEGEVLEHSSAINFYLIREAKAAFVPFSSFGTGEDVCWFRASVGASSAEEIAAMLPRVRAALEKLG